MSVPGLVEVLEHLPFALNPEGRGRRSHTITIDCGVRYYLLRAILFHKLNPILAVTQHHVGRLLSAGA